VRSVFLDGLEVWREKVRAEKVLLEGRAKRDITGSNKSVELAYVIGNKEYLINSINIQIEKETDRLKKKEGL